MTDKRDLVHIARLIGLGAAICLSPLNSSAQDARAATTELGTQAEGIAPSPDAIDDEIRALLIPHRQAVISSLLAARVKTIHVRDGDRFKQGDVLISFNCAVQTANLRSALAKQKQYQITHDANVDLRKDEGVSKLDVALSAAKLEEGRANVELALAQHRHCKVKAPYDGRVAEVSVNEHESVEIGSELITILDNTELEMTLHLPSPWIATIATGRKFKVSIDETGKLYDASVMRISPKIDPTSHTFKVTAHIVGQQDDLVAGMSGNAHFGSTQ